MVAPTRISSSLAAVLLLLAAEGNAGWLQWGRTAQHDSASSVIAQPLGEIEVSIVVDPFGDDDGVYTQNDGLIYIVKRAPRSRAIRR